MVLTHLSAWVTYPKRSVEVHLGYIAKQLVCCVFFLLICIEVTKSCVIVNLNKPKTIADKTFRPVTLLSSRKGF